MDPQGRVGLVERIEVNAVDLAVEEIPALLGRPVNADLRDRLVIALWGSSK